MRALSDLSIFEENTSRHAGKGNVNSVDLSESQVWKHLWNPMLNRMGLCCTYICRCYRTHLFCQRRDYQSFLSLEYIQSGEMFIRNGKNGFVAESGDLFLLQPGMSHDLLYLPEGEPCVTFGIIITGTMLGEHLRMLDLQNSHYLPLRQETRFLSLFEQLKDTLKDSIDLQHCERNSSAAYELLLMLSHQLHNKTFPAEFAALIDFFEQNYHQRLDMRKVASLFGMSAPTLCRKFQVNLQVSPYQYLIQLRMRHACRLLQAGALSIKEIAEQVGYDNPLHFSTEFHRTQRCSPREYRARLHGSMEK